MHHAHPPSSIPVPPAPPDKALGVPTTPPNPQTQQASHPASSLLQGPGRAAVLGSFCLRPEPGFCGWGAVAGMLELGMGAKQ